jgi:hypothetical protein
MRAYPFRRATCAPVGGNRTRRVLGAATSTHSTHLPRRLALRASFLLNPLAGLGGQDRKQIWGKRAEDLTLTYLYLAEGKEVTRQAGDMAEVRERVAEALKGACWGPIQPGSVFPCSRGSLDVGAPTISSI